MHCAPTMSFDLVISISGPIPVILVLFDSVVSAALGFVHLSQSGCCYLSEHFGQSVLEFSGNVIVARFPRFPEDHTIGALRET